MEGEEGTHLVSLRFTLTWTHLDSLGLTWIHLDLLHTYIHTEVCEGCSQPGGLREAIKLINALVVAHKGSVMFIINND